MGSPLARTAISFLIALIFIAWYGDSPSPALVLLWTASVAYVALVFVLEGKQIPDGFGGLMAINASIWLIIAVARLFGVEDGLEGWAFGDFNLLRTAASGVLVGIAAYGIRRLWFLAYPPKLRED